MMLTEEQQSSRAARHRLESEILILQSDKGKRVREYDILVAEIRTLKNNLKRLEIEIEGKVLIESKLAREISMNEAEIAHLKKKMNLLV